jgi:N-acetylglucosaminyldiphosphoundecaprenol N-acetyl-beta-D-mannosaminyltransferase
MKAKPPVAMNLLGTRVSVTNMSDAVARIADRLRSDWPGHYICVADVHCIMQSFRRPEVRAAYNSAEMCVPDGMPLTWVGRLRGHSEMDRVYGPDLMLRLLEVSAEEGFTNFFCGGAEGVAEELAQIMTERFPGLSIVGTYCPPFRELLESDRDELIHAVNSAQPDILWVGLGAPKQDLFMREYHGVLEAKMMIGVGAAFDFHTGRVPQAPRWMMRSGLEWLFRLVVEPRRLGPRYLRNNPLFLWHVFLQQTGLRRYPSE